MTNKQRRALRRQRAREKQQRRTVQQTTAVTMQTVRAGAHTRAREQQDRFEVDLNRRWYVIRTLPRWSARAAEDIRRVGIPVFEAREAVRLVSDIGKRRLALIPVLSRMIFVGVEGWQDLRKVESHPGINDDSTVYRSGGVMRSADGMAMLIPAEELQNFADSITGHGGDAEKAKEFLFAVGQAVRVLEGPFASFPGSVEGIDPPRNKVRVGVGLFGSQVPVELDVSQVEAA